MRMSHWKVAGRNKYGHELFVWGPVIGMPHTWNYDWQDGHGASVMGASVTAESYEAACELAVNAMRALWPTAEARRV